MNILVTDDEPLQLNELVSVLERIRPEAQIYPFIWPDDALEAAREQSMDVAFLDIQTGGMTGLELAVRLKELNPAIHIIFVTGYSQYALDAFAIHATGYVLKPVTEEAVERELTFIYGEHHTKKRIEIKTFGGFDVYVDGQPVRFGRQRQRNFWLFWLTAGAHRLQRARPMRYYLRMPRIHCQENPISAPLSMR